MNDDAKRLQALIEYGILDTPPEPEFDDIVLLAQSFCQTPFALVSLVAVDRQWFKARVGFAACETPIDQSVCAHALGGDGLLIIPDLTVDPRTKDNRLVIGPPHIRFYAGAVLETPDGIAIGTICVIDDKPRPEGLTADQSDVLRMLARQTMALLMLRRAMTAREEALLTERTSGQASLDRALASEAQGEKVRSLALRQRNAQEAGGIGTFDVDIATDRVAVSSEFCRVFGLAVAAEYSAGEIQACILERDRKRATTEQDRREGHVARETEFRVRRARDGAVRWVLRRAEFQRDGSGNPLRLLGVVQDITERKLAEIRGAALVALSDSLRDATKIGEATRVAAGALGETLGVSRAGYAAIDLVAGLMKIEKDWTIADVRSLVGTHPLEPFSRTIQNLKQGHPLVIANIPAAAWLSADQPGYLTINTMAQIKIPLMQRGQLVGVLFMHSLKPRTWSAGEIEFAQDVADRTYAAVARLQAEEHQQILNQELSHRLKNTLSMVQAIATQTLRSAEDKEAVAAFEERVIALSRAHDVLLEENWAAARIRSVVERVLGLHGGAADFEIAGANITLNPKATLSLSLLLHEMATNAVKYGALSRTGGKVVLSWNVDTEGAPPALKLSWAERGGPPAVQPSQRGFGTRLISMGIGGAGGVSLNYTESGLVAHFSAPMSSIIDS